MRFPATVIVIGSGVHGPFENDKGTEREGRTIPYANVTSQDGGEPFKATAAEGVDVSALPLFKPVELLFELYPRGGALKLRTFGPSEAAALPRAA